MPVVNVMLVDDSAVIRGLMSKALSADAGIHIIATASDGQTAINAAKRTPPDVIVLDIEMPGMDGITALPELLKTVPGVKVIMASTLTLRNAAVSLQALELGASDYLPKPSAKFGAEVEDFYRELISKVKALGGPMSRARVAGGSLHAPEQPAASAHIPAAPMVHTSSKSIQLVPSTGPLHVTGVKAIAIASSTGGPQALLSLFEQIKGHFTGLPIFITQHMPPNFTTILAEHIGKASGRPCTEGKNGEKVEAGHVYLAPGDFHMVPQKNGSDITIHTNQNPQENFCRPAADPMLRALSGIYGRHLLVVVLTGMGQDGMLGAKEAVAHGASVVAQDEASCVVYGMPKAVVDQGLCRAVLPLPQIGQYLITQIEGR